MVKKKQNRFKIAGRDQGITLNDFRQNPHFYPVLDSMILSLKKA